MLAACKKPKKVVTSTNAGVEFTQLVASEPDESLPLVVAIHGLGGAPEHWVDGFSHFPGRATIALPRGFERHEKGFRWFPWSTDFESATFAADIDSAEQRLWRGIADLAGKRRVVVTGFSEGGILTYRIALRHADVVAGAFPVSGAIPPKLRPQARGKAAPIVAYHGTTDPIVPIEHDRATVTALSQLGYAATLREYAGVGHAPNDKMHDDVTADMVKVIASAKL